MLQAHPGLGDARRETDRLLAAARAAAAAETQAREAAEAAARQAAAQRASQARQEAEGMARQLAAQMSQAEARARLSAAQAGTRSAARGRRAFSEADTPDVDLGGAALLSPPYPTAESLSTSHTVRILSGSAMFFLV